MPISTDAVGTASRSRLRIRVQGAVQGVGFRPFVYRHASALALSGWVENSPAGVTIEAEGDPDRIAALIRALRETPPPNATVTSIDSRAVDLCGGRVFAIRTSEPAGERTASVLPDLATCEDCVKQLFDPADRRYRYPFINCTHCGPRYSIIEDIPYDRARTSMRHFPMCAACRAEYEDPADRRFHAEPNACPDCGPRLTLWDARGSTLAHDDEALAAATEAIRQGRIVAVKGIGGFHLLVDARDEAAVARLRQRKRRKEKPFAVMFPSLADIRDACTISTAEEALLTGPARPIVLLRRVDDRLAASVAPGNPRLGAFLPYAPLHHLLLHALGFPIVATSGNVSDEPIATDEKEALERLAGIADLFLVHDRPIVRPVDDSVARVVCREPQILRRARGYAPAPIAVPGIPAGILALGGHLKTTVAVTRPGEIVLGQHIGDLETVEARIAQVRAVADTSQLYAASPRLAVCDRHPDYPSTRAAEVTGLPVVAVQHHLAHVAACIAEHGIVPPVLGVAWDGTGYGMDGTVWGGEFLLVTKGGWRRVAHLRCFRLPGGEAAAREPRRAALGLLYEAFGEAGLAMTDLAPVAAFSAAERAVLKTMLARGVNAPWCSSAGRLFDAFAALCGLRQRASYEGQAAAEFEWAAEEGAGDRCYEFPVRDGAVDGSLIVDWQPALEAALADLRTGAMAGTISAAFHRGLAAAIAAVARRIGEQRVVLSGGCFQNVRLTEATVAALHEAGHEPLWHRRIPPNDGGIALGQAAWAGWCEEWGESGCA
ncbi:MAG TPA: carbamoyltransferase HypF [Stellaceae bacterium]|nr:carbamoyltransferase HypF [Stellaceae bacterium]